MSTDHDDLLKRATKYRYRAATARPRKASPDGSTRSAGPERVEEPYPGRGGKIPSPREDFYFNSRHHNGWAVPVPPLDGDTPGTVAIVAFCPTPRPLFAILTLSSVIVKPLAAPTPIP